MERLWKNTQKMLKNSNNGAKPADRQPDDIVEWVKKHRKIDGKRFSFQEREYLLQIYRDPAKENYIVKARQMEATEFALNWILFHLLKNPNTTCLYVTDRADHISVFSRERLRKKAIGNSEFIKSQVSEPGNESYLPFKNGSVLWMFSGWDSFESARSISSDFVVIDEMQSLDVNSIATIKESLSKSRHGKLLGIGTGSIEGDAWWKTWHRGNQQEWNSEKKIWIPRHPENTAASSYHLPQTMASWKSQKEIEEKRLHYPPRDFENEVAGWWYRGAEKPLIESDIMALYDHTLDFTAPVNVDYTAGPVYIGIDWGGGTNAFTVIWVWQLVDKDMPRFRLLYAQRLDEPSTEMQADRAIDVIEIYQPDKVVVDAGGGARQVEKLSNRFAELVYTATYLSRPEKPFEVISSEHRLNVDRTWAIETIIDLIKRPGMREDNSRPIPRIDIPGIDIRRPEVDWVIENFTCISAEVHEPSGRTRVVYTHPVGTNDDAMHSCVYAYLAFLADQKTKWAWFRFG